MKYVIPATVAQAQPSLRVRIPTQTGYARLETSPLAPALDTGLRAELADPLWLLARQWQFNEFEAEDAGTPIRTQLVVDGLDVTHFAHGIGASPAQATALAADGPPLEARVEAEPVLARHPRANAEAAQHLLRLARDDGQVALADALRAGYPWTIAAPEDAESDPHGQRWALLLGGRAFDAAALRADLAPLIAADGSLTGMPPSLAAADTPAARALLSAWWRWLDRYAVDPATDSASWNPARQEYAFSLFAATGERTPALALRADEYTDGRVDWDDFVAGSAEPAIPGQVQSYPVTSRTPVPVRYPGMPADRYWEFEDGRVNFGGIDASAKDLARIVLTEFALAFGNDWFLLPIELPTQGLYRVRPGSFRVVDSFGMESTVGPSQNSDGTTWTMYELSAHGPTPGRLRDLLFLPAVVDSTLAGDPLEELLLVRDEMANLAWGVERRVQGTSGEPLARSLEATRLAYQQKLSHTEATELNAELVYRLATQVPAHWIPLVPRRKGLDFAQPLDIVLRRAGMARFYALDPARLAADPEYAAFIDLLRAQNRFVEEGTVVNNVGMFIFHPRGLLLRADPLAGTAVELGNDSLELAEEEVPRDGAVVTRRFQYARTPDGGSWLWIGRAKRRGRGEAASGLKFDHAARPSAIGG